MGLTGCIVISKSMRQFVPIQCNTLVNVTCLQKTTWLYTNKVEIVNTVQAGSFV